MRTFVLAVAFSLAAIPSVPAQERPLAAPGPALADFMGLTQMRHIKLTFAGKVLYPNFANVPFAKLVDDISEPALAQIESAVKAKDHVQFWPAVEKLTEACNSCHRAAGFGFIAIRIGTLSPFSDQVFDPTPK
jgi:hypothetical protein